MCIPKLTLAINVASWLGNLVLEEYISSILKGKAKYLIAYKENQLSLRICLCIKGIYGELHCMESCSQYASSLSMPINSLRAVVIPDIYVCDLPGRFESYLNMLADDAKVVRVVRSIQDCDNL